MDAPETFKAVSMAGGQRVDRAGQRYTIQVAPEDCTGCNAVCVGCARRKTRPTRGQTEGASTWRRSRRCAKPSASNYRFFLDLPETRSFAHGFHRDNVQVACSSLEAAVRVLGRLRRLRRDPLPQAAHADVRRPAGDRQRHRLLLDLRRQPADHALHDRTAKAAAPPGPTRCSRTTPSSGSECAYRGRLPAQVRARARPAANVSPVRGGGGPDRRQLLGPRARAPKAEIAAQRERLQVAALKRRAWQEIGPRPTGPHRPARARLETLADALVPKSVWLVGGDGWAYDIGYGGLDHVLVDSAAKSMSWCSIRRSIRTPAARQSKATPLGAAAKFAILGQGAGQRRTSACSR